MKWSQLVALTILCAISTALHFPHEVDINVQSDRVSGWLAYPSQRNSTFALQIHVDGQPLKRISSPPSFFHQYLGGEDFAKSYFDVPITIGCGDHEVSVSLDNGESAQKLLGSKHVHKPCNLSEVKRIPAPKGDSPPTGQLLQATLYELLGSASDADCPSAPLKLSIFIDGIFFTSFMSNGSTQTFTYRIGMLYYEGLWLPLSPSGLPLGYGNHVINVYVCGVDASGLPDGLQAELTGSPVTLTGHPDEYVLATPDNQVRISFRANYGGSITSIHDNLLPYNNLVDDDTSGALFQTAFWVMPLHSVPPPNCANHGNTGAALLMDNPTQGGHPNGFEVNPIGYIGTTNITNPLEFIRWEDSGHTLHFKKRYINYNYCLTDPTPLNNLTVWDTDFYLEQWASLDTTYNRTLKLQNIISYVGPSPFIFSKGLMASWAIPTIFGANLPYIIWEELEIPEDCNGTVFNSQSKWAALVDQQSSSNASGLGLVYKPTAESVFPGKLFLCEPVSSAGAQGEYVTELSGFLPALESFGDLVGVNRISEYYQFAPNGTFSWTTYHPIGSLSHIRTTAQALQASWPISATTAASTASSTPLSFWEWLGRG